MPLKTHTKWRCETVNYQKGPNFNHYKQTRDTYITVNYIFYFQSCSHSIFFPTRKLKLLQKRKECLQKKMTPTQLIVAVEGTAAVGPFWQTIVSDYLEKIIRYLYLFSFSYIHSHDYSDSTINFTPLSVFFRLILLEAQLEFIYLFEEISPNSSLESICSTFVFVLLPIGVHCS